MNELTIQIITPIINLIIVAIGGYLTAHIVKLVPVAIEYVKAHIGLANYTKLKAFATDIFYQIEEDGRLGNLVYSKSITFSKLISDEFPMIPHSEIITVRQAIAGEFNKDKPLVVKTVEVPTIAVKPIIKYFAEDGVTELQPINALVANTPVPQDITNTEIVDDSVVVPVPTQTVLQGV